jgi:hypothetical protein
MFLRTPECGHNWACKEIGVAPKLLHLRRGEIHVYPYSLEGCRDDLKAPATSSSRAAGPPAVGRPGTPQELRPPRAAHPHHPHAQEMPESHKINRKPAAKRRSAQIAAPSPRRQLPGKTPLVLVAACYHS